jgi:hypothetical protein
VRSAFTAALAAVGSLNPATPISTAVNGAIRGAVVGGRLILDVDLDRALDNGRLLERVSTTIADRLKSATGETVRVHATGSRLIVEVPLPAWERLWRIKPGLPALQSLFVTGRFEFTLVDDEDATLVRLAHLPPGIAFQRDHYLGPNSTGVAPYLTSTDDQTLLAFVKTMEPRSECSR